MSSSGQYQTAVIGSGGIYYSNNYGGNWSSSNAPSNYWYSVSVSAIGQYQTAVVYQGGIYLSNDYGQTWSSTSNNAPTGQWYSVAISYTGQYQTAIINNGGGTIAVQGFYISNDFGSTWNNSNTINQAWTSVSMSYSGQYQTAVNASGIGTGQIYTCYDPLNLFINGSVDISGNLVVSGSASATNFITTSDYRIKDNVQPIADSYTLNELKPVMYFNKKTHKDDMGLIAHELQEYYPFLVNGIKDGPEYQSVNYIGLIPVLIKEIQELKRKVQRLEQDLY